MDFRVLGRVRVLRGGGEVDLGTPKQRLLLAVLVANAGTVVSTAALVDALWGPAPPQSAVDNTYLYVSRLRRALGADRLTGGRKLAGYALAAAPEEVDARRFTALADEGEAALRAGDAATAAETLRAGLALWQGSPYADFADEPSLLAEVTRLTERRLRATEQRVAAELALGRTAGLADELTALVEAHPYRERFAAQLMTVLHRTGRQAEALDTYQRTRTRLRDQLGIEPGTELREAHRLVLAEAPASPARPAQLPADVADFVGRERELAWLSENAGGTARTRAVRLVSVSGIPGVGKTALAVHWGHREAHLFPDGQLFVDLHGFGPGPRVPPATALAGFLRALGTSPDAIPGSVAEAAAAYRSLLDGRRVLVVLDNAADADQVRPLLPGAGGCVVVVTSRERLTGLVARDGGRRLTLDVLDQATAVRLIEHVIGPDRVGAAGDAARSLAALCGHLPLALRISAAMALDADALRDYVAALGVGRRMRMLAVEDDEASGVRVAFDHSYATLTAQARRTLRYLGLVPGPDVARDAVTALLGSPAGSALAELVRSNLVLPAGHQRYRMHDLLCEYARDRALTEDVAAERDAALGRLLDHYVTRTDAAARVLDPTALRLRDKGSVVGEQAARAWFDREQPNLVAAVTAGTGEPVWLLADALRDHFWRQQNATDALAVANAGLAAATGACDRRAVAAMRLSLGLAHVTGNRNDEGVAAMRAAAEEAHDIGWRHGEAAILSRLGDTHVNTGDLVAAGEYFRHALRINEDLGATGGQAHNRNGLGGVELQLGRPDAAAEHYAVALGLYRASGATGGEAVAITNLATIDADRGRLDAAADGYTRAIELYRRVGRVDGEVRALIGLAGVRRDTGDLGAAAHDARAALELLGHTDDGYYRPVVLTVLGSVERLLGALDDALAHHVEAVALARQADSRYLEAEALVGLAEARLARAETAEARRCAETATTLAHDFPGVAGRARIVLAQVVADRPAAAEHARRGLELVRAAGLRLHEDRALDAVRRATAD